MLICMHVYMYVCAFMRALSLVVPWVWLSLKASLLSLHTFLSFFLSFYYYYFFFFYLLLLFLNKGHIPFLNQGPPITPPSSEALRLGSLAHVLWFSTWKLQILTTDAGFWCVMCVPACLPRVWLSSRSSLKVYILLWLSTWKLQILYKWCRFLIFRLWILPSLFTLA